MLDKEKERLMQNTTKMDTILLVTRGIEEFFQKTKNLLRMMPRYNYSKKNISKGQQIRNRIFHWDKHTFGVSRKYFVILLNMIEEEIEGKIKSSLSPVGKLQVTLR